MLFNSIHFLIFFPVVITIFYIIPRKLRCIWLLAASYYFYMSWNPKYAILIASSTLVTYLSGIGISAVTKKASNDNERKQLYKKIIVAASLIFNLGILFVFKYSHLIGRTNFLVFLFFKINQDES